MSCIPSEDNNALSISEADHAMFRYFGVLLDLIIAFGILRVNNEQARTRFDIWWRDRSANLSGLIYPYYDPITGWRVTCRLRLDHPIVDASGKVVAKYLAPPADKARQHLFFPPNAGPRLKETIVPVLIVESEKSEMTITGAAQRADRPLLVIGCGGCMGWWGRHGTRLQPDGTTTDEKGPLPDFYYVEWKDRPVTILFDSNARSNLNVRRARRRLAMFLTTLGAKVLIAELGLVATPNDSGSRPDGQEKQIVNGPDDFIARFGDHAFWDFLCLTRLWLEAAIEEAKEQLRHLEEKCKTNCSDDVICDCDEVLAAIAAVDAADKRPLLIGKLAALRLPGVTKKYIETEVDHLRWAAHKERQQAKQRVLHEEQNRVPLNALELVRRLIRFYSDRRGLGLGVALIEALFCLMTYVFDVCDTVPYLLYVSATASCGKSTSLERHEAVCCRARKFTDPSPAVIYRLIEDEQPTVLLDEAELLDDKSPRAAEIKALFNEGYKRSGQVPRCEEENGKRVIKWYRVYGPKILAKIGNFKGTILSRGIVIHLTRTYKLLQSFSYFVEERAAPLRELLEAYATQKCGALIEIYKQQRDQNSWPFLTAREYEIFMALLLHARLIGNEYGEEGRKFETEAIDVVRAFTTHKIYLVGAEDEQLPAPWSSSRCSRTTWGGC